MLTLPPFQLFKIMMLDICQTIKFYSKMVRWLIVTHLYESYDYVLLHPQYIAVYSLKLAVSRGTEL